MKPPVLTTNETFRRTASSNAFFRLLVLAQNGSRNILCNMPHKICPPSRKAKSGAKVHIFLGNKASDPPQKHGQKRHTKQNTLPITKKSTPAKAGNRPYLQEIDRERGRGMEECAFFRIFAVPSPP